MATVIFLCNFMVVMPPQAMLFVPLAMLFVSLKGLFLLVSWITVILLLKGFLVAVLLLGRA